MGPVAVMSSSGEISYNFTAVDMLYDGIMAAGVTPIVEVPIPSAWCCHSCAPTNPTQQGVPIG